LRVDLQTQDGRRIISGLYSTEEERRCCLNPTQFERWKQLEKTISERDTGTIEIVLGHNRKQQSIIGTAGALNPWGHAEGTIGNSIDYCVQLGIFTKEQIMVLCGTKMTKISSHLRYMAKNNEYVTVENSEGIISFDRKLIIT
jgi:hypothetical protein